MQKKKLLEGLDHICWTNIYIYLAYMASFATTKKLWNTLNWLALIAEGGTYAEILYIEQIMPCDVFQRAESLKDSKQ